MSSTATAPELTVLKIGGNVIDDEGFLASVLADFAKLPGFKILVHGGGKAATELSTKLGLTPKMIDGRRVTDAATLDVAVQVYAGLINKKLVARLYALGTTAIGLTGADFDMIRASKRKVETIDYGWVGDVEKVNAPELVRILKSGLTPVMAPITHDGRGQLLNTNADTIANEVAKTLAQDFKVKLIYSFEKSGVLKNINDESSVISAMSASEFQNLKSEGVIFSGMIPKLESAFQAIRSGVHHVVIGDARKLPGLVDGSSGTRLRA